MTDGPRSAGRRRIDGEASASLGTRAVRGVAVTTSGQALRLGIQMLAIVVLARLLTPADYGLVAMASLLVALSEIFREFGLGAAAVATPRLTDAQRDNLFWANTGLGLLLFLVAQVLAIPIAHVFDDPDVVALTRVLAVTLLINGVATQYRAHLTRQMRFTALTGSEVLGQAFGLAVGVATALWGWGYWSLAAMQIGQAGVTAVLLAVTSGWLPGRIHPREPTRDLFSYGGNLLGAQVVGYVANHADALVIGSRLGAAAMGIYDRAYRLVMMPLAQLRAPLTTVSLPTLSRLNADGPGYDRALLAGQISIGFTVVPLLALVAGAHEPLTTILLGEQWGEAAGILGLLAVVGVLQMLAYVGYWVYLSRSLTRTLFGYSLISAGVRIAAVLVGIQWGAAGVAASLVVAHAILFPLSLAWLARRTPLPMRRLVAGVARILILAAGAAAVAWLVAGLGLPSALLSVVLAAVGVVAVYVLAALLSERVRADVGVLATMLGKIVRRSPVEEGSRAISG